MREGILGCCELFQQHAALLLIPSGLRLALLGSSLPGCTGVLGPSLQAMLQVVSHSKRTVLDEIRFRIVVDITLCLFRAHWTITAFVRLAVVTVLPFIM